MFASASGSMTTIAWREPMPSANARIHERYPSAVVPPPEKPPQSRCGMLYATSVTSLPLAAVITLLTDARTSPLQSPNQKACGWPAILSIWAASSGRDERQASACCLAFELGSTYIVELCGGGGAWVGAGVGVTVGDGVDVDELTKVTLSTRRLRSQPPDTWSLLNESPTLYGPAGR